jgi:hypothetical protein
MELLELSQLSELRQIMNWGRLCEIQRLLEQGWNFRDSPSSLRRVVNLTCDYGILDFQAFITRQESNVRRFGIAVSSKEFLSSHTPSGHYFSDCQ